MANHLFHFAVVVGLLVLNPHARGVDAPFQSGLPVGTALPGPFEVWCVTGDHAGKFHCPVCAHGLEPNVLVFIREPGDVNQALSAFLKNLDVLVAQHQTAQLGVCVIFLNDGGYRDALVNKTDKLGAAIQEKATLEARIKPLAPGLKHVTLALAPQAGPEGYNINPKAFVTVFLCHKHKVVGNYAFPKKPDKKELDPVLKAVETLANAVEQRLRPRR